jgi:hypothetical protein
MPLQRQNCLKLSLAPELAVTGATLDELLPPSGRPGDLQEPWSVDIPMRLKLAAREAGIGSSLAFTVVAERCLVTLDLAGAGSGAVALLDARASSPTGLPTSHAQAAYTRVLVSALNGGLAAHQQDDPTVVVPTRLAARLRETSTLEVGPESLRAAIAWELAAVRAGRTMTEWALGEVLATVYPASAARHVVAAASAAR